MSNEPEGQTDKDTIMINQADYVIESEDFDKNYYLHGFTALPKKVISHNETELQALAKQNGHKVDKVIIEVQNADGTISVDEELTNDRINEIKETNDC
jgi:hypothetical protein